MPKQIRIIQAAITESGATPVSVVGQTYIDNLLTSGLPVSFKMSVIDPSGLDQDAWVEFSGYQSPIMLDFGPVGCTIYIRAYDADNAGVMKIMTGIELGDPVNMGAY